MLSTDFLKLIILITLAVGASSLFISAFMFYYKYLIQEKRCKRETIGKVIGYGKTNYGDGAHPPIVEYIVNNKKYITVGPEYRGVIVKASLEPFEEKKETKVYEDNKHILYIFRYINAFAKKCDDTMELVHPRGSEVAVYYDEQNPKLSYVERYYDNKG